MTIQTVNIGIDPGASGAIAFFDLMAGELRIIDMPTIEVKRGNSMKREVSAAMLAEAIKGHMAFTKDFIVTIEKVGAMPNQGVSSMFQFGRSVGTIEGVCAALTLPINYVTPQRWQKDLNTRSGKDGNRLRAMNIFPKYVKLFERKKDDGRADAALIAYWAATNKSVETLYS